MLNETNLIVGIGASAGGLEPLEQFFDATPMDSGMAFIVVQHLSPDYPSLMNELLARHTRLPIHRVENGMTVTPNAVYLIPPRMNMEIQDGKLSLIAQERNEEHPPLPIDVFFHSLAKEKKEKAVAIVLSGTGTDGSRGVKTIKDAGGLVLIQDQISAKFHGMPKAAYDTGVVDAAINPGEMPAYLLDYLKDPDKPRTTEDPTEGIDAVISLLNRHHEIDFSFYKPTTVHRRIERRAMLSTDDTINDYVERLKEDHEELNRLYKDLLIGVTQFFRDTIAFESLEQHVIPKIFNSVPPEEEIRVWIAGCATGEEAYSIAILFDEARQQLGRYNQPVRIFATDAHRKSIDYASAGCYESDSLRDVMPERLQKYFIPTDTGFKVAPLLRHMITFAQQNMITDAPFTRMHLVTCRNVLIYFQAPVQTQVLSLLHFALKPNGHIFLGPSETTQPFRDEFEAVDPHWRIYRKRRDIRLLPTSHLPTRTPSLMPNMRSALPVLSGPAMAPDTKLLRVYDALLEEVIDAAVLVNERREIVHVFGQARDLLKLPTGRRAYDILSMLDPALKPAVGAALQKVKHSNETAAMGLVRIDTDFVVAVSAHPIPGSPDTSTYTLIRLERQNRPAVNPDPQTDPTKEILFDATGVNQERIVMLEQELQYTKENLQTTIEELETSNEELNATNEELIASNEELQSTNEELHSVNEELHTVNAEYQQKITELAQLTDDMNNLLASTDIGIIFVDSDLKIRRFTPATAKLLKIRQTDIGRPLDEIRKTFEYDDWLKDAAASLTTGDESQAEITHIDGKSHYLTRTNPYRMANGQIDGLVITFVDISKLHKTESKLAESEHRFEAAADSAPILMWLCDATGSHNWFNQGILKFCGKQQKDLVNDGFLSIVHPEDRETKTRSWEQAFAEQTPWDHDFRLRRADGEYRWMYSHGMPRFSADGEFNGYIGVMNDITERRQTQEQLTRAHDDLRISVEQLAARNLELDQFAHAASHDLRTPLRTIVGFSQHAREVTSVQNTDHSLPPELTHDLSRIDAAARRMSALIDALLLFATLGRQDLNLVPTDLNKMIAQIKEDLTALIGETNTVIDVPEKLPRITCDPALLRQVFQNLIANGINYRSHQPPMVRIRSDIEGDKTVFSISDNGVGIPEEACDRIFKPFQRLHPGSMKQGSGLGLSICKRVVLRHQGKIWFTSNSETGTTFFFSIPRSLREKKRPEAAPNFLAK